MDRLSANSGDPDQTPKNAASDLGQHCFANFSFGGLQTIMD